ncbi:MAG: hypothetical protein AB2L14_10180 [Candidatus Xenobiia bacterium LiM19]
MKDKRISKNVDNPFWITYSDLFSSLVMIFLILIFCFVSIGALQLREQEKQAKRNTVLEKKVEMLKIDIHARQLRILKDKLETMKKKYPKEIEVDKKRGIASIKNKILFDSGSSELKPDGKTFLNKFMQDWSNNFLTDSFVGKEGIIEQIIIEGHADPQGVSDWNENYKQNMTLSLFRSESVLKYIFSDQCQFREKEKLREKISASGRSNIESFLSVMKHKNRQKEWNKADMPMFRSVNLKLIFVNPLLEWEAQ